MKYDILMGLECNHASKFKKWPKVHLGPSGLVQILTNSNRVHQFSVQVIGFPGSRWLESWSLEELGSFLRKPLQHPPSTTLKGLAAVACSCFLD